MLQFHVPQITCGHCVRAITEAMREIDNQADVEVDIKTKTVRVHTSASPQTVVDALARAGYPPA